MEKLLEYFMEESNRKHQELKADIASIKRDVANIHEFKVSMIVSARTVSFIISAVCGLITMVVSVWAAKN